MCVNMYNIFKIIAYIHTNTSTITMRVAYVNTQSQCNNINYNSFFFKDIQ